MKILENKNQFFPLLSLYDSRWSPWHLPYSWRKAILNRQDTLKTQRCVLKPDILRDLPFYFETSNVNADIWQEQNDPFAVTLQTSRLTLPMSPCAACLWKWFSWGKMVGLFISALVKFNWNSATRKPTEILSALWVHVELCVAFCVLRSNRDATN